MWMRRCWRRSTMRKRTSANSRCLLVTVLFCVGVRAVGTSQVIVPAENLALANRVFAQARGKKSLPCYVEVSKLHSTDVLFRQVTSFNIEYPSNQIQVGKPL